MCGGDLLFCLGGTYIWDPGPLEEVSQDMVPFDEYGIKQHLDATSVTQRGCTGVM